MEYLLWKFGRSKNPPDSSDKKPPLGLASKTEFNSRFPEINQKMRWVGKSDMYEKSKKTRIL